MEHTEFNFTAGKSDITCNSSDYLNNLVLNYRKGLPGSSEALLEAFAPLMAKYYRLFKAGIWDIDDKEVTGFLKMLGSSDMEQTAEWLVRAMSCYESGDLQSELVLILLSTAQKYMNIAYTFKYEAKTRILELVRSPIYYNNLATTPEIQESVYPKQELDTSWINGLNVGSGFDQLTPLERAVIKYLYNDGLSEAQTAKLLHVSTRQLRRYRKAAKERLAQFLKLD